MVALKIIGDLQKELVTLSCLWKSGSESSLENNPQLGKRCVKPLQAAKRHSQLGGRGSWTRYASPSQGAAPAWRPRSDPAVRSIAPAPLRRSCSDKVRFSAVGPAI